MSWNGLPDNPPVVAYWVCKNASCGQLNIDKAATAPGPDGVTPTDAEVRCGECHSVLEFKAP